MQRVRYLYYESIGYPLGVDMKLTIYHATKMAEAFNLIAEYKDKNLNIFCRGSSGAMLAAIFTSALNWPNYIKVHHIKKEGENSHSSNSFSILNNAVSIIIDDLICTGKTIKEILTYVPDEKCNCLILADNSEDYTIQKCFVNLPDWFISGTRNIHLKKFVISNLISNLHSYYFTFKT